MEKSTVLKSFDDLRKHSPVIISIPATTGEYFLPHCGKAQAGLGDH